ncbi:aspartate aminotransferase family protein [Microlunatus speluncae]|uniref:aspartate aminotransferase family protein n=1 Tax=Microlunatus speluncae TaxID=2594267 RepID=UPI0012662376|nr:aspartate aminotransferase family protein [Microlunatus speluncae]
MNLQPSDAPRGRALAEAAAKVIPGGVNSATRYIGEPYAFTSAQGAYLTDLDGTSYLDYHAAFGAILLGHNAEPVNRAMNQALTGLDLSGLGVTELEVALAERICSIIPSAESMIATVTGSEATAQAIRLSRAATGRRLIVKFQGGFHGWHDPVARNVISAPDRAYGLDPLSAGILPEALESTLIAEFNDLGSVQSLLAEHDGEVAAIILEPIPHNVGALVPTAEFVQGLRELCTSTGTVLIFDEVITGFRHALGGYQSICGVTPDLTTFGKGMANGYPVGGLAGRRDLMEHFNGRTGNVLLAGTFNGNPLGCAAALATLDYLAEHPEFYTRTFDFGAQLRTGLDMIVGDLGLAAHAAGFGGVFNLYFTPNKPAGFRDLLENDHGAYVAFHRSMINRGFLMLPMSLKRNHVSGAHTQADIDRTLEAAEKALADLAA